MDRSSINELGKWVTYQAEYLPFERPELTPLRAWIPKSMPYTVLGLIFCIGGLRMATSVVRFAGIWWQNLVQLPNGAQRLLVALLAMTITWSISYCVGLTAVTFLRSKYRNRLVRPAQRKLKKLRGGSRPWRLTGLLSIAKSSLAQS